MDHEGAIPGNYRGELAVCVGFVFWALLGGAVVAYPKEGVRRTIAAQRQTWSHYNCALAY